MAEIIWRSIIRFDKALTEEMWGEVHEMLKLPMTCEIAARLLCVDDLRKYRQMRQYQNHPPDYLFAGIPIELDKE